MLFGPSEMNGLAGPNSEAGPMMMSDPTSAIIVPLLFAR